MMGSKRLILYFALGVLILLPYVGVVYIRSYYLNMVREIRNAEFIIVDKRTMKLTLYDYRGVALLNFPMACGKNYGDKQVRGDMRTPEGVFHISSIEDASEWSHDFKDGQGEVFGAYGPWFIRIDCPGHSGIGIHGTHLPESIGTRATEGCIRVSNENLLLLKERVYPGMVVVIIPSTLDVSLTEMI